MTGSLIPASSATALRTYWTSNHGKQMKVVLIALAGIAGFGVFKALPLIILGFSKLILATSLATAGLLSLAGLGALAYFLTRPALWQAITIRLNNMALKQRRKAIEDDPIGAGEQALASMRANHQRTKDLATKVHGAVKVGEKQLEKWRMEREQALAMYQQAVAEGNAEQKEVQARRAQVRADSIAKNALGVANATQMWQLLGRVEKNIATKLVMFTDELTVLKQDLELKGIVAEAGRAARKTMQGPEYDQLMESMEVTINQISQFEAGIEQFVTDVMPSIREEDLRNGMLNTEAIKNAEQWLRSQDKLPDRTSVIESAEARQLLTAGPAAPVARLSGATAKVSQEPPDFSSFLDSRNSNN